MKRLILALSFIAFCGFEAISQATLYTPRALIIPFHTDTKQIHISGGFASSVDHGSVDVNVSYSFTKKFAFFASTTFNPFSYSYMGEESIIRPRYHYKYNNLTTSFGVEYFKSGLDGFLDIFETQMGLGYSNIDRLSFAVHEGFLDKKREYDYKNMFCQLSATKTINKFDVSMALRTTYVMFNTFKEYEINGDELVENSKIPSQFYFEPSIGCSYRIKGIKLNLQVGGFVKNYSSTTDQLSSTTNEKVLFSRIAVQYNL
jgi:hypothetical protein